MKNSVFYTGCSGFSYKEWKNRFYPEKLAATKWLAYYATVFNTVEINMTFYRKPSTQLFQRWYDTVPDHFSFSVKAPRLITHYRKFVNVKTELNEFYSFVSEGLREKAGCILFQLPPSYSFTPERLEHIIGNLSGGFMNVVEFRHASWWNSEVMTACKEAGIVFCGISHPTLPDELIKTAPVIYYRFHGTPELYYSSYDDAFMQKIAASIRHKQSETELVYLYFNNTASVAAVDNAKYIRELLV
ncbi:DUF72 domain-containing protein [Sediminibacterium ginsengisoli]|uniref:Uncharacterized conserved protein YecE, DUF72 family n=1 Tax=Sediminibacterium ginsengisoli TaxID=413434 RepID=A0A1T4Q003_9BACT|nr:DUF72 domain-containing protein [Sediminibacterium ginsengisoli]SJZ97103.1 Uncharacterized conserved protein YecE, DUF72 family [Sediminibacterium ginsengisoli]